MRTTLGLCCSLLLMASIAAAPTVRPKTSTFILDFKKVC